MKRIHKILAVVGTGGAVTVGVLTAQMTGAPKAHADELCMALPVYQALAEDALGNCIENPDQPDIVINNYGVPPGQLPTTAPQAVQPIPTAP